MGEAPLIIIGSSGHAGVVIDAICKQDRGSEIRGLLDDFETPGKVKHGYRVLGKIEHIRKIKEPTRYFIAVGDNNGRSDVWDKVTLLNGEMVTVGHPLAIISGSQIERGVFVAAFGFVGNGSHVYEGAIINTHASLDHDCILGSMSHLAPGAVTGGHVTIGHHTLIGIGAMIRDRVTVGNNCVIGMGSVVTKDVPDNSIGWGNPFKVMRENRKL